MQPIVMNDTEQKVAELKFLLNNISHAILFESLGNEILFINQNFCDLFAIPVAPELLVGADCSKSAETSKGLFLHPDEFVEGIRKIYAAGLPVMNEELVLADGRSIYRDYKPIPSNTGYSGHLWIYKYSLELKSILHEEQEQKDFYEHLLNNIPADIAIFSTDHKYVFINKTAISVEEKRKWLIGKDDFEYSRANNKPPYLAVSRRALFLEALKTGNMIEFEEENETPSGSKVYNLRRFYPLRKENGEIQNVIGYGMNITKIREREFLLKEQEQAFRDLVDSMDQLVLAINESGVIAYANPRWCEMMGEKPNECVGKKIACYIKTGKDNFLQNIGIFFKHPKQNLQKAQVSMVSKKGRKHIFSYYLSTFTNLNTGENRAAVYFNDITEQLQVEKKLKKVAAEERKLNELKSSFMSLVSHELRTPLSVILSSAELIELMGPQDINPEDSQTAVFTDRIIRQVDKMTQLMTEFLFLSKVEAGRIPFNPQKMNLPEFLEKLKMELYNPWKDGRTLHLSVKGNRPWVMADELMLSHTVSNLVNNAFKYSSGQPAPLLRLYFFKRSWKLLLVDSGLGIPAEEIKKVFLPFTRGGNVREIEGTGFGLNIVRIFVKTHKGSIRIKSTEGKGTAVLLQFPY